MAPEIGRQLIRAEIVRGLLREENVEAVGPEILGAARAFLAGG